MFLRATKRFKDGKEPIQRHGYSRDKRGDCLRVVIALVLTPDGFPLAYEVLSGNTNDREAQMPFIRKLEEKYGKIGNLWLMDRGVPTEKTLKEMRESGYLKILGDALDARICRCEWRRPKYMIQSEIEYAFHELKNDLGLTLPAQLSPLKISGGLAETAKTKV